MATFYAKASPQGASSGGGSGVTSLNSETGDLTITAGTGIAVTTPTSTTIQIASTSAGDVTLTTFGSTPNDNAASLSSQALTLQPADATHPGGVSTGSQTFGGTKTFANIIDSGLTASQAVVTDGSKQLASLAYASANTASALVQRDGSGNFSAGTITASLTGHSSLDLAIANNLSDVASAATSFNNISGFTALGDTHYGGASGIRSVLAGQITTTKKYLSQTGNGSVSAAPAWAQVAFSDLSGSASAAQMPALTGDVTTSAGAVATTAAATQNNITSIPNLATVGTISSGTWSGTTIAVAKGGTGLTSGTSGGVLAYTASGTLASSGALAQNGVVLGGGAGVVPATLATDSSTTKWLKSGGTNTAPAWTAHTAPTVQVFTSGTSQTYTTPGGCVGIQVELVGPGGGGGGSGTTPGNGSNGSTATVFSTVTGNVGVGGSGSGAGNGTGGTASSGDVNLTGADGGAGSASTSAVNGGNGGSSYFGGGAPTVGAGGTAGKDAKANTGSGGGGATANSGQGTGGGAGGYARKFIASPAATYTYTVGAGGAGGTAGTGGQAGGAGAAGIIIVTEYY